MALHKRIKYHAKQTDTHALLPSFKNNNNNQATPAQSLPHPALAQWLAAHWIPQPDAAAMITFNNRQHRQAN